ncbi:cell division protein FtsZ [Candidatus Nitrosopumilus sediminis]|uniref:Tubulin/FtsZ GTPase n=1 Tax=Candidatus Nitrosopumilus sediminis TaxID=1229909 RepID=K0BFV7_9ARCH|nr:cell division protein FtsZ [Candidatus Nitrosopumilus sediminis]AFS83211.1 tubulin/FtsZ GTPase [Candidatus Nitrosopumilus sediminis]
MSFQVKEPVLVIGIGGVGSKLAMQAKESLNSDCLLISNDKNDLSQENPSVHVSTDSVVNPSIQLIRGSIYKVKDEIKSKISSYSTVILMSNLAGKAGSAMAPVVSEMCKESDAGLISFAIMPFKYEKDRIFNSGVSLKRVRENSECTIVLDNDSLLESNPDLSPKSCYDIANSAMMHVIESLGASEISSETNIISTSKNGQNIEDSLRDSLKMLYGNAPPNSVKRSMLYVVGGSNIPVGVINSITNMTAGIVNESNSQIDTTSNSDESKVVMLSSIQGMTKFDNYDPLGMIPQENTLDWSTPDCSIDCELDLYQLE